MTSDAWLKVWPTPLNNVFSKVHLQRIRAQFIGPTNSRKVMTTPYFFTTMLFADTTIVPFTVDPRVASTPQPAPSCFLVLAFDPPLFFSQSQATLA